METIVCDWGTLHKHGPLWYDHLRVRKSVFVDDAGWNVPHTQDVEWDQYDTPLTKYVITHALGQVLAASRLMPCDYDGPVYSYMIRDAALGRLPSIPATITQEPCTAPGSYEATRFTVDPSLPRQVRNEALRRNAIALMEHCDQIGAQKVFALMPPGFVAWLRRAGLEARPGGPVTTNDAGEVFCVIECHRPFFKVSAAKRSA